ncbi:MAG: hypothetical protein QFX33_04460 [Candidatus Nezhaarchaeota archaeon]|nr:hypothetical protein [Candidatus Nezhaarchaeota archaeon]
MSKALSSLKGVLGKIEKALEDPPRRALGALLVLLACFLLSGGFFPPVMGVNVPLFLYPSTEGQTGAEAFVVFILVVAGVSGLLIVEENLARHQSRTRGLILTLLGVALIILGVALTSWLMYLKLLS